MADPRSFSYHWDVTYCKYCIKLIITALTDSSSINTVIVRCNIFNHHHSSQMCISKDLVGWFKGNIMKLTNDSRRKLLREVTQIDMDALQ